MRQLQLFRWAAALTLAIALAPGAAPAQEEGTITISSTFTMDWLDGTVGPDLAEVYANGHDHTWTLKLYGTTQSHSTSTFLGDRRTISVSIKGDRKREPDEVFYVELSHAVGATISDAVATVTILNDD